MHLEIDVTKPKKGEYPFHPIVRLCLAMWSRDQDDRIVIGPHLMTNGEVDYFVNGLIEELERFRKSAKKALPAIRK
jgi:hypothetical protein